MQAQYQLDFYTKHKRYYLAGNISGRKFLSNTENILNISTVKYGVKQELVISFELTLNFLKLLETA